MSENSKIEWTDHTFNPWEGCQKVSPGCDHYYAEARNVRFGGGQAANFGPGAPRRRTSAANWQKPMQWNARADAFMAEHGRRQRVFCASLADVFDNAVPVQWRIDLMALILKTPNLDWLLLTKRIGNAVEMLEQAFRAVHAQREGWADNAPPNVWIGATITSQTEADRDIPKLLAVPAAKRLLRMEPLLGPVDLRLGKRGGPMCRDCADGDGYCKPLNQWCSAAGINWAIVGGESGPHARPMHPAWARSLWDQCEAAGVPFLFKQWGEFVSVSEVAGDGPHYQFPDGATVRRVGKKVAGRLLDGIEHNGFPE